MSPTSYFSQIINKEGKVIKEKKTKTDMSVRGDARDRQGPAHRRMQHRGRRPYGQRVQEA
jgi:hypothetical protein